MRRRFTSRLTRCAGQSLSLRTATLRARNPAIWGDGTTACASDSKHFGAWDQNLTTQWHVRYGGPGHHDLLACRAVNRCASTRSSSRRRHPRWRLMIEGVIRHCTEMEVDRQYVDSPWSKHRSPSRFCRLSGLPAHAPRLKAIPRAEAVPAGGGSVGRLSESTIPGTDETDRLGTGPPAIRPDVDQVHNSVCGSAPQRKRKQSCVPVHPQQRPTPDLPGVCRSTRQAPSRRSLCANIFHSEAPAPRGQRGAQRDRELEQRQRISCSSPAARRVGEQSK